MAFTRHCLLVRSINLARPDFQLTTFPLSDGDETPLKENGTSSAESIPHSRRRVDGIPAGIPMVPVKDCVMYEMGVTPTKILNFSRKELRVLDFLTG